MASASDHRALQPADCLILLPQRLPAAVETSIGPAHYPAECTQSDAFLQPSLRARNGRANSNSLLDQEGNWYLVFLRGAGTLSGAYNDPDLNGAVIDNLLGDSVLCSLDLHTPAKLTFSRKLRDVILTRCELDDRARFSGHNGSNPAKGASKFLCLPDHRAH